MAKTANEFKKKWLAIKITQFNYDLISSYNNKGDALVPVIRLQFLT